MWPYLRTVLSKKQCVKFNDRHAEAIVETPLGSSGNESLRFAGIPFRPRIIMVTVRIHTRYDGSGRGCILSSHGRVPSSTKVTFYLTKTWDLTTDKLLRELAVQNLWLDATIWHVGGSCSPFSSMNHLRNTSVEMGVSSITGSVQCR